MTGSRSEPSGKGPSSGRALFDATLWNTCGALVARGLGLLATVLVARLVGTAGFGELGLVLTTVAMAGTVAGLGAGTAATRFIAEAVGADPGRAGRVLDLTTRWTGWAALAAGVALAAAAPLLAGPVFGDPDLATSVAMGGPLLAATLFAQTQAGQLAGLGAFRALASAAVIGGLAAIPLQCGGALLWGVPGAILGQAAAEGVRCLASARAIAGARRALGVVSGAPVAGEWRRLLSFGVPATLASLLVAPVSWLCAAVVNAQPEGLVELGFFQATQQYRTVLIFPATQVYSALIAVVAGTAVGAATAGAVRRGFLFAVGSAAGMAALLAAAAPWAMAVFGEGFAGRHDLLWWLAAGAPFQAANTVLIAVLNAHGRGWAACACTAGYAAVAIIWALARPDALGLVLGQAAGSLLAGLVAVAVLMIPHRPRGPRCIST